MIRNARQVGVLAGIALMTLSGLVSAWALAVSLDFFFTQLERFAP